MLILAKLMLLCLWMELRDLLAATASAAGSASTAATTLGRRVGYGPRAPQGEVDLGTERSGVTESFVARGSIGNEG